MDRAEIVEQVAGARERGATIFTQGGGVDSIGPRSNSIPLETAGLNRLLAYEPADLTVTCEAGMRLSELQKELEKHDQFLPVWHPWPDQATIGGLIASGYTGLGCALYGRLRDRVLEVHFVTGDGRLVRAGGKVVKNVTGFDLAKLLCGSFGKLGIIVEVTLKVHPMSGPLSGRECSASELAEIVRQVPVPIEAVLTNEGGWAFCPGPATDAEIVLGSSVQESTEIFERLATHKLFACRDRAPWMVFGTAGLTGEFVGDLYRGVAWTENPPNDVKATRLGTLSQPQVHRVAELSQALISQFDPDGVFV